MRNVIDYLKSKPIEIAIVVLLIIISSQLSKIEHSLHYDNRNVYVNDIDKIESSIKSIESDVSTIKDRIQHER
jgi:uncharacterized protein YoxC